jgi:GMP synthase (glutamine-hydrolysing)
MKKLRYLLIQIRAPDDPMRQQEVDCFARSIECDPAAITTFDLLAGVPDQQQLSQIDALLVGGSGDYSAAGESPWLERTMAGLRRIVEFGKPTFASCWGFQAFARAAGGRCIHDPAHAELGTIELRLSDQGRNDPLFGTLPTPFFAQAGHEDHVVELPPGAVLLASSPTVTNQAFKFADAPIYCTQFHPELDRSALLERLETYPQYVEKIAGTTLADFAEQCRDTPETQQLLKRFAEMVVAGL